MYHTVSTELDTCTCNYWSYYVQFSSQVNLYILNWPLKQLRAILIFAGFLYSLRYLISKFIKASQTWALNRTLFGPWPLSSTAWLSSSLSTSPDSKIGDWELRGERWPLQGMLTESWQFFLSGVLRVNQNPGRGQQFCWPEFSHCSGLNGGPKGDRF